LQQEVETIRKARRTLDKLCRKLMRPTREGLDSASADAAAAVKCLQDLESGLASGERRSAGRNGALETEIRGLRRDVGQAALLLDAAAKFYQGWARLVSEGCGDESMAYNAAGKQRAGSPVRVSEVVLHG
jgi:hypothetical protein